MSENKVVVLYHANCMDGFGSAFISKLCLDASCRDREVFYIPVKYGEKPPLETIKNADVFILDFSYPYEQLKEVEQLCNNLLLLDHHKTAKEALIGRDFDKIKTKIIFDMTYSGVGLTWNWFNPGQEPSMFVLHIEDRDLWKFKYKETKHFTQYLSSLPMDFTAWEGFYNNTLCYTDNKEQCQPYQNVLSAGKAQEQLFNQQCENIAKEAVEVQQDGFRGYMVNCNPVFASQVGSALAVKDNSSFGLTYFIDKAQNYIFSIRSVGAVNISEMAKAHGGGGHRNAAGFRMNNHNAQEFIYSIIREFKS